MVLIYSCILHVCTCLFFVAKRAYFTCRPDALSPSALFCYYEGLLVAWSIRLVARLRVSKQQAGRSARRTQGAIVTPFHRAKLQSVTSHPYPSRRALRGGPGRAKSQRTFGCRPCRAMRRASAAQNNAPSRTASRPQSQDAMRLRRNVP